MGHKRQKNRLIRIIAALIAVAVLCAGGWWFYNGRQGSTKADSVMSVLKEIIPGLGEEEAIATGMGRDPLAAVSIEGLDIVGVIEIPALDISAPVTSKDYSEEYFASWLDGSPVQGLFKIIGGRDDLFRKLAKLKPGDRVTFTDIEGVRYTYEVRTQYHLKKWDAGDNDMQLCCESDSDTYFVVGCETVQ